MQPYPGWLDALAWASLGLAFLCALIIVVDYTKHRWKMWIMYVVWPVTALYFGPVALVVGRYRGVECARKGRYPDP